MITYELVKKLPVDVNKLYIKFKEKTTKQDVLNNLMYYINDTTRVSPTVSGDYLVWLVETSKGVKKLTTLCYDDYYEMTIEMPRGLENKFSWYAFDGTIEKMTLSGSTELPINFSQVVEAKEIVDWLKIGGRDAIIDTANNLFVWKDATGNTSDITATYAAETDGIVAIIPNDVVVTTVQWTAQEPIPIEQMYHQVLHSPFFPKTAWAAVVNSHGDTLESAMTGVLESIGEIEPKIKEYDRIIPDHENRIATLELASGVGSTYNNIIDRLTHVEGDVHDLKLNVANLEGDIIITTAGINALSDKIGNLANLTTTHKSSLVDAINDAAKTGSGGSSSGGGSITLDDTLIADSANGVKNSGLTAIIGLDDLDSTYEGDTIKEALNEVAAANVTAEYRANVVVGQQIASNMLVVDSELSETSTNPVQNKAITAILNTLGAGVGSGVSLVKDVRINNASIVGTDGIATLDLSNKADVSNTYTKTEVDTLVNNVDGLKDVKIDGTSIVSNKIATIPDGSTTAKGAVQLATTYLNTDTTKALTGASIKAELDNTVHKTGIETINGKKNFTSEVSVNGLQLSNDNGGEHCYVFFNVANDDNNDQIVQLTGGTGHVYLQLDTPKTINHAATKGYVDTAVNVKADDNAVMHNTGDETVSGVKEFFDGVAAPTYTLASPSSPYKLTTTAYNGSGMIGVVSDNGTAFIDNTDTLVPIYIANPTDANHATTKEYVDNLNDNVVHKTGNETIDGYKTFNKYVVANENLACKKTIRVGSETDMGSIVLGKAGLVGVKLRAFGITSKAVQEGGETPHLWLGIDESSQIDVKVSGVATPVDDTDAVNKKFITDNYVDLTSAQAVPGTKSFVDIDAISFEAQDELRCGGNFTIGGTTDNILFHDGTTETSLTTILNDFARIDEVVDLTTDQIIGGRKTFDDYLTLTSADDANEFIEIKSNSDAHASLNTLSLSSSTGSITLTGITNVTNDEDATNKKYVDDNYLPVTTVGANGKAVNTDVFFNKSATVDNGQCLFLGENNEYISLHADRDTTTNETTLVFHDNDTDDSAYIDGVANISGLNGIVEFNDKDGNAVSALDRENLVATINAIIGRLSSTGGATASANMTTGTYSGTSITGSCGAENTYHVWDISSNSTLSFPATKTEGYTHYVLVHNTSSSTAYVSWTGCVAAQEKRAIYPGAYLEVSYIVAGGKIILSSGTTMYTI